MQLKEYQEKAMKTCLPESNNFLYMFTNLAGELGEFSGKVAKAKRKGFLTVQDGNIVFSKDPKYRTQISELKDGLFLEAGDILWQLSGLCTVLGYSLEDVAMVNLNKLSKREEKGVIDGSGDNR